MNTLQFQLLGGMYLVRGDKEMIVEGVLLLDEAQPTQ